MAFEEIHTITTLKQGVCATISYKPIATNSGRKLTPKLIIGIPKAQAAGFSPAKDATFVLKLGTGPDFGKARIVPGPGRSSPSHI